jgi:hypothetical protein
MIYFNNWGVNFNGQWEIVEIYICLPVTTYRHDKILIDNALTLPVAKMNNK